MINTTISLFLLSVLADAQNFEWVKQFEGEDRKYINSMEVDQKGNIYVVGYFFGPMDVDPGDNVYEIEPASVYAGFIVKLDAAGNFLWGKVLGNTVESVVVDKSDNVYLAGWFTGTKNFGVGDSEHILTSKGEGDAFLLKLDQSGNFIWVGQIEGEYSESINSVSVDQEDNVTVSGNFGMSTFQENETKKTDFEFGSGTTELTSQGKRKNFVAKYDSSGGLIWVKDFENAQSSNHIIVTATDNIYFSGSSVFKIDKTGELIWSKNFGGFSDSRTIAVGSNESLYLVGDFYYENIKLKDGNSITITGESILKIDSAGFVIWAKKLTGNLTFREKVISIDENDNIYITGYFSGNKDFDPGENIYELSTSTDEIGNWDAFVLKLDSLGNFVWVQQLEGKSSVRGGSIITDNIGNIYCTGLFDGDADFDPGTDKFDYISEGADDIYILKLSQTTTAIRDDYFNASISYYPNPTTGKLTIELGKVYSELNVSVKNISGQEVISEEFKEVANFQISTNDLIPGIYFLELTSQSGNRKVLKFIKE